MKAEVRITTNFSKRAKPLLKKYPSLFNELETLAKELADNPQLGQALGSDCYKIRILIKSKGKGKSGGARIIMHTANEIIGTISKSTDGEITVYLLTIYDKSETASISTKELKELIKGMN